MKKIYVTNKKAFTLIEIILALIVSSIIAAYSIQTIQRNSFFESLVKLQNKIVYIVESGLTNSIGYANGTGGNCSTDFAFSNLTTKRLADCLHWDNNDLRLNLDIPPKIIGLDLMSNYGQCMIETEVDPTNDNRFYIFADCSELDISAKQLTLVEDSIKYVFENELSAIHVSTDDNSIGLGAAFTIGGNGNDGQIRALFEL